MMRRIACPRLLLSLSLFSAVVVSGLTMTACSAVERIINRAEKPTAKVVGGSLTSLSLDGAEVTLDVEVMNPYDVPLPLTAVDLALVSRASTLVTGRLDEPATIPANQSESLKVPIGVTFAQVMQVLKDVRPGEVLPYEAQATLKLDAPGIGPLSLPLAHRGDLPVPAVPTVSIDTIRFDELSLSNAAATVRVAVSNPNAFEAAFRDFGYSLDLAGVEVGRGEIANPVTLKSKGAGTFEIPLRFSPRDLGVALFQTLMSGEASYRLHGGIDVRTPFGALDIPYDRTGATALVR